MFAFRASDDLNAALKRVERINLCAPSPPAHP
jgi:hypothetical protein